MRPADPPTVAYKTITIKEFEYFAEIDNYDITVEDAHEFYANGICVKNCMGKFHPHGDLSIYNALVTQVNKTCPPVKGQGNFGDFNSGPAAQRYSECKLSEYADKLILNSSYLHKNVTDFMSNYDGEEEEPVVLPALVPNILFNGSEGIAVGVVSHMPPFAIKGVMKLINKAMAGEKITARLCAKYLQVAYRSPFDGPILSSDEDLLKFYETGEGTLKIGVGYTADNNEMIITKFTPHAEIEKVILKIQTFLDAKTSTGKENKNYIPEIASVDDITSEKGYAVRVRLRPNTPMMGRKQIFQKIADELTESLTLRINYVERVDENKVNFMQGNMPALIERWVKWRIGLEVKLHIHLREQLLASIHRDSLAVLANENIEKIAQLVKTKTANLVGDLAKLLKIEIDDAKYILSLSLQRISGLSKVDLMQSIAADKKQAQIHQDYAKHPTKKILLDIPDMIKQVQTYEEIYANDKKAKAA